MPKTAKKNETDETIGDRIRRFRKRRGLTQTELGETIGLSQRQMTYYETEGGSPSPDLLIELARALEVSVPVLLGTDPEPKRARQPRPESLRLWKRFQRLEELPEHDRKTVLKMIDALADQTRRRRSG
ncbi:MAG: helix-turn-helix domain-containing protein [Acidobacteria bacterium]|nr:helix-turn-helix domain-containing protein [Acidobacteriota bacterium]